MPHLLCFGLGYSGRRLALDLLQEGWTVSGTSRSDEGCARLAAMGITGLRFDGTAPLADSAFDGVTHVLGSAPPDEDGDPALRHHQGLLQRQGDVCWAGYLSTTGVYGDHQGGWVDEETPPRPHVERSRRRLRAEHQWGSLTPPAHVFRLAGIYGPGRNPLLQVQAGTARCIIKHNQWFSRIHVADIAAVVRAAMTHPHAGRIYNVCDDLPTPPQEPIRHAATVLGVAPVPSIAFEDADLSPMARSFYADSRRVRNQRIKDELHVQLTYPTYKEGLAALRATL